jgi:hypothetical protein
MEVWFFWTVSVLLAKLGAGGAGGVNRIGVDVGSFDVNRRCSESAAWICSI